MTRRAIASAALMLVSTLVLVPGCGGARNKPPEPTPGRTSATPPAPPASGPGSMSYPNGSVTKNLYGEGATAYWIFEPADPRPASAPVVLFLHGWRAVDPRDYGGWIDHIARRGNIVIYPVSEAGRSDSADEIMKNAITATKAAIARLRQSTGVKPDFDKFAIVGHSMGGGLTAQIAARAQAEGLPTPKAIMATQPGWRGSDTMPTDQLGKIPSSVLMLVVVGAQDQFEKTRQSKVIWDATKQIPADQKRYITIPGDDHGSPALVADHSSPLAYREDYGTPPSASQQRRIRLVEMVTGMRENRANALNYWGYYRLFDALEDAAFSGKKIDAVLAAARPAGKWSDGTAMKPFVETTSP